MSYLDVPRIHIGGQFFTDPSTVNNDPAHYDPACINPSPWQEPNGEHRFQLRGCTVKSAMSPTGFVNNDPIIGATVASTDLPIAARLVDLDVYQQGVPTIFGMQVQITFPDSTTITGLADPATLNGLWFNAVLPTRGWNDSSGQDSPGGDMEACGYFQTVIRVKPADWKNTSSPIMQQLKSATITDEAGNYMISWRFVTDGYENAPTMAHFRTGRIVGTFGIVKQNEPLYSAGARWLQPRPANPNTDKWFWPTFNPAFFKVDAVRSKLVIDLANSICRATPGGPPVDLGTLNASAVSWLIPPTTDPTPLGAVDYSQFSYENNAGIVELPLTQAQLTAISFGGLVLTTSRADIGVPQVLFEQGNISDNFVEVRPQRMEGVPGTTATTRVYVTQAGNPLKNYQLSVFVESVYGKTPGATVPPTYPGDTAQSVGALSATISPTDSNGFATVTLTVNKDPGQRTAWLDGQLYFVIVWDPANGAQPDWQNTVAPTQEQCISVVVYSNYAVNQNPSWGEIQSMMAPYMRLYPSMKNQIDLTDQHTFNIFSMNPPWSKVYNDPNPGPLGITAGAIPYYMSRDFNDPRFMPISRDLSAAKTLTLMYFVKNLQANPPQIDPNTIPKRPKNT